MALVKRWTTVVFFLMSQACFAGIATPRPIEYQGYTLVKNWSFVTFPTIKTDDQLRSHFHTRYKNWGGTQDKFNDEWQRYRDNDNHVFGNREFALVARAPAGLVEGRIESGMLRSKWTGQYGYFEARLKMPKGRGMWPAFWLVPDSEHWPPELDIVEMVNNGREGTMDSFHFVHTGKGAVDPATYSLLDNWNRYSPGYDFSEGFHTFAVLWEPGRVRHFVDGVLVVDRPFDWTRADGSDAGPAHLLLNLAVGGRWPGPPLDLADFPAQLKVDFIRIWQK